MDSQLTAETIQRNSEHYRVHINDMRIQLDAYKDLCYKQTHSCGRLMSMLIELGVKPEIVRKVYRGHE